jgi:hypothetical protein
MDLRTIWPNGNPKQGAVIHILLFTCFWGRSPFGIASVALQAATPRRRRDWADRGPGTAPAAATCRDCSAWTLRAPAPRTGVSPHSHVLATAIFSRRVAGHSVRVDVELAHGS